MAAQTSMRPAGRLRSLAMAVSRSCAPVSDSLRMFASENVESSVPHGYANGSGTTCSRCRRLPNSDARVLAYSIAAPAGSLKSVGTRMFLMGIMESLHNYRRVTQAPYLCPGHERGAE